MSEYSLGALEDAECPVEVLTQPLAHPQDFSVLSRSSSPIHPFIPHFLSPSSSYPFAVD